jgi:hypothetical protein
MDARKLARQLYRDDESRADEVPVERDGRIAYERWLQASRDAGDSDTREALEAADRAEFEAEWNILAFTDLVHDGVPYTEIDANDSLADLEVDGKSYRRL